MLGLSLCEICYRSEMHFELSTVAHSKLGLVISMEMLTEKWSKWTIY